MNSRERVMAAVNHQEPDRVPIDLGGHRSSGIMAIAYNKLKRHLGIKTGDIYVYDLVQQLAIIEPEVLHRFGVDVIELGRGFALAPEDWRDWTLPDGTACKIPAFIEPIRVGNAWHVYHQDGTLIAIQKEDCLYFEQTYWPYAADNGADSRFDAASFSDLEAAFERVMWANIGTPPTPIGFDEAGLKKLVAGAKKLRASTDRAIIGLFGGNLLENSQFLFGMENLYVMLAADRQKTHHLYDKLVELHLGNLEKFLGAVGPYIDIILFGDDLGMQTGPQISPKMYREYLHPRYKLMWGRAKELADVKVMLHCCGGVYPLLPGLIEAGLDIIQPVQTNAKDMEPQRLKHEFGQDLCLWGGGCDTQWILPQGTPDAVAEDVRRNVSILAPGGGFVFQQVHNVLADVPPENIVAMLEAVNP
jgi:uroporphyrinogen decarboxylase